MQSLGVMNLLLALLYALFCIAAGSYSLLPHGVAAGDTFVPVVDDGSSGRVPLQIHIPFFGTSYSELWVCTNGLISFRNPVVTFTPSPFPLAGGEPLVAPFWADVNIENHGSISYRETIDPADLSAAQSIVAGIPAFRGFQVEMAFVATWKDVAAFGVRTAHIKNSFQCVLMTDGQGTLAAFLYDEIVWTTGTASRGNSVGLGGTPAQVGFDSGDGERYHAIPASRTAAVLQLTQLSNVDIPGLFVYEVHQIDFGANPDVCELDGALGVSPLYDSPAGGEVLTVSTIKECLDEVHNLACVFTMPDYRLVVPATFISRTSAWCIAAPMERLGRATLGLSLDGGNTTTLSTGFFFLDQVEGKMTVEVGGKLVGRANPALVDDETIRLSWTPSEVEGTELDLVLRAFGSDGVQDYYLVARAVPNNGTLLINGGDIGESVRGNAFEVPMLAFDFMLVPRLAEEAQVGLGWRKLRRQSRFLSPSTEDFVDLLVPAVRYAKDAFFEAASKAVGAVTGLLRTAKALIATIVKVVDREWTEVWDEWLDYDFSALQDVCVPCTSQQAAANEQDWVVDTYCPNKNDCDSHPGSDICYRQRVPNPDGSCWQVCYLSTDASYQLDDGRVSNINDDPAGAGTADRVCGTTSSVLHGFWDGLPYLILRATQHLKLYNEHRPQPIAEQCCEDTPQPAAARGDPHFDTLDGFSYTFNGKGEFWLLRSEREELKVQVRTEEVLGSNLSATVFTAFVVKTSASPAVQVSFGSSSRETLQVLADGEVQYFDEVLTTRDFGDVSVVVHPGEEHPRVAVRVSRRLVLDIKASSRALGVVVGASPALLNATVGLLGVYDGVQDNDLMTPNGTVIPPTASSRQLHYDFGLSWMLPSASESLFKYRSTQSFESLNNRSYVPVFLDDILRSIGGDGGVVNDTTPGASLCAGNIDCLFDLHVTHDPEFANATLVQEQEFVEVVEEVREIRLFTAPTTTRTTTVTTNTSTSATSTSTNTSTTTQTLTSTTSLTATTTTQTATTQTTTSSTSTTTWSTSTTTWSTSTTTQTNTTTTPTLTTSTSTTATSTSSTSTSSTSWTSRTTTMSSTDFADRESYALRSPQLTVIQYVTLAAAIASLTCWHSLPY